MDILDIKRMLQLSPELLWSLLLDGRTNLINVSGGSDSKLPLSFVTRPNVYREEVGDSVLLLCKVNNLGKITTAPWPYHRGLHNTLVQFFFC